MNKNYVLVTLKVITQKYTAQRFTRAEQNSGVIWESRVGACLGILYEEYARILKDALTLSL